MARIEDLTVVQGTDASFKLFLTDTDGTPKDITDKTFIGSFKKRYNATTTYDFDITVDVPTSAIILSIPDNVTSQLEGDQRYVFDVVMHETAGTDIKQVLSGKIYVKSSVTRV